MLAIQHYIISPMFSPRKATPKSSTDSVLWIEACSLLFFAEKEKEMMLLLDDDGLASQGALKTGR